MIKPTQEGDTTLKRKPTLLWVDLTMSVRHAELSPVFTEACEIKTCPLIGELNDTISQGRINGVCFDFDYPDQSSLNLVRKTKARFPGLPLLVVTLQHSESLAVWAFRTGVIDYLVKPVSRTELHRSLRILSLASEFRASQPSRELVDNLAPIPPEIPAAIQKTDVKLLPAIYYVKRNFQYKIKSEFVADLCELSPFRFSRLFRETYGLTFQDYVIRYRILEACRLLMNPSMNVTDVAYAVGFNDASYFSRTFRRCVGVVPSSYCAEVQIDPDPATDLMLLRTKLRLPDEGMIGGVF